jgi:hypothetical protein
MVEALVGSSLPDGSVPVSWGSLELPGVLFPLLMLRVVVNLHSQGDDLQRVLEQVDMMAAKVTSQVRAKLVGLELHHSAAAGAGVSHFVVSVPQAPHSDQG